MSLCINPKCQQPVNSDTTIFCKGCGSELLLDGRYRVLRELGQGGFGITYEAIDAYSHSWVLKVLMDNHPKYVSLFQQEAQILGILNHSGIPKVDLDGYFCYFTANSQEPLHCLVMEKIEGMNLSEYIKQRGHRPIQPKRALRWLAELTLILQQVHDRHFFHRDIKPENIMLRSNGSLVLIDFGTVREVSDSYIHKQASGQVTGVVSQGYTPMEQLKGKAVLQSDFYALGGTTIFLLTAQNPGSFYDFTTERLNWRDCVDGLSSQFADLIDYMMAYSPLERPRSSKEIFQRAVAIDSSLKVLAEEFNSPASFQSSSISSPSAISSTILVNFDAPVDVPISEEFIERCRQELAEFIGPMANIVCKRTLKQNPRISRREFCSALAKTINDPQQAGEFQQRLL